jgi:hypothetical protein
MRVSVCVYSIVVVVVVVVVIERVESPPALLRLSVCLHVAASASASAIKVNPHTTRRIS